MPEFNGIAERDIGSHELCFGTTHDVSGLQIYGCPAFVHVAKEKKSHRMIVWKNIP
jgi:hypothetical protein